MRDVVVVEAVRSAIGKRNGGLATMHALDLLGAVQQELVDRADIDPTEVEQVIGGCVDQVGMQTMNVARNAWLAQGLPISTGATTVDNQCGSSQQASTLAVSMIKAGVVDTAIACGVEIMSKVPMGSTVPPDGRFGKPVNKSYWKHHEFTSQFEGAERIAEQWGFDRSATDEFGLRSQTLAAQAWDEDRFSTQILPIDAPVLGEDGKPTGETNTITRDEGLRDTTLDGLAQLKPVARENGVHTAGSSSQVSDGASGLLLMAADKAQALGLTPLARVVDVCNVGSDPVLMLTGPIEATRALLQRNNMAMSDVDLVEINEAFASVVLAWQAEMSHDMDVVNPNGGAIAHGHPLGATGTVLLTKAIHEMHRADKQTALVTMCCGGGLGTGTLLERI